MIQLEKKLSELDKNDFDQLGFLSQKVERAMFEVIGENKIRVDCGLYLVALATYMFYDDCFTRYGGEKKDIPGLISEFVHGIGQAAEQEAQKKAQAEENQDSSEE